MFALITSQEIDELCSEADKDNITQARQMDGAP